MFSFRRIVEGLISFRQHARRQFGGYELAGVAATGLISAAIGAAFYYDNVVVSLGVLGASVFNGILCYLVGLGIGRRTGAQDARDRPQRYWFSVRDLLWLTLAVGVALGWIVNRGRFERQRIADEQTINEVVRLQSVVAVSENAQSHWKEGFKFIKGHYAQGKKTGPPKLTDAQLKEYSWQYSPEAGAFQIVSPDGRATDIEWQSVLLAFPWLSPNDLAGYIQAKGQPSP
jgi:hypothetical protein